jgi:hypothetical protein
MGEIGIRSGGKDLMMEQVGVWSCVLLLLSKLQLARCATNVCASTVGHCGAVWALQ